MQADAARIFRLDGEVAVVTGGGSGLGLAIARCLHAAGARVVLVGRRGDVLEEAARGIGEGALWQAADITDFAAMPDLVARIEADAGRVSILANNAGNHLKKSVMDTTVEDFASVLDTHVLAAHNLTRAVLPGMIERRTGSILFTASMTSLLGMPQVIAYSAAKSAYVGMVRALSAEVAEHGVRVNAIAPGWIESPMLRKALDGDEARSSRILQHADAPFRERHGYWLGGSLSQRPRRPLRHRRPAAHRRWRVTRILKYAACRRPVDARSTMAITGASGVRGRAQPRHPARLRVQSRQDRLRRARGRAWPSWLSATSGE